MEGGVFNICSTEQAWLGVPTALVLTRQQCQQDSTLVDAVEGRLAVGLRCSRLFALWRLLKGVVRTPNLCGEPPEASAGTRHISSCDGATRQSERSGTRRLGRHWVSCSHLRPRKPDRVSL